MGGHTSSPTPPTPPPRAMIKTGAYTGNGADDRNIDIGINLAAKNNVYVIAKVDAAGAGTEGRHRIEYGQGDVAMLFAAGTDEADFIQGFTATGFQVGISLNTDTQLYRWVAFWEEP